MPGFGRRVVPKLRQLIPSRYRLNSLRVEANLPERKAWYCPWNLDQDGLPQCVSYAAELLTRAGPVTNKFPWTNQEFYDLCQNADEWPGTNYDGTSVRAAGTVLKEKGILSSFEWAFDHSTALKHGLVSGPMDFGTDWYEGMMEVDEFGFVRVEGRSVGGHSYLCPLVDRTKLDPRTKKYGAWRIAQTWSRDWGQKGRAWITFADMEKLIEDYGEALLGNEVKIKT